MEARSGFNLTAVNGALLSAWARLGIGEAVVSSGESKLSSLGRTPTPLHVLTSPPTHTRLCLLKVCFLDVRGCSFGGVSAGFLCVWLEHFHTFQGSHFDSGEQGREQPWSLLRWVLRML